MVDKDVHGISIAAFLPIGARKIIGSDAHLSVLLEINH
jgi:hypothetical protein